MSKQHEAMMKGFDGFAARMAKRYGQVRDCLEANRLEEAQQLLAEIAMSHAKTSLSLRSLLIRQGRIPTR